MLEMVAPEASYVKISGQILQNHDFLVRGKTGWYLVPAQELLQIFLDDVFLKACSFEVGVV